jgi:hypothetical protein
MGLRLRSMRMTPELTPEQRKAIYEEEKRRLDAEGPSGRSPIRLASIVLFAVALIVIGTWIGSSKYRTHALNQKLAEAIGTDRGLTETILKIETESSKITYGELFELCNKSVESRTNLIVELRGVYPQVDSRLKEHLIEYLTAENEFVRSKRDFYRHAMEESYAFEAYLEAAKNFASASYGWEVYLREKSNQRGKVLKASHETTESADDFLKAYEKMGKQEAKIRGEAAGAGLNFAPIFSQYAKDNTKRATDAKTASTQYVAAVMR